MFGRALPVGSTRGSEDGNGCGGSEMRGFGDRKSMRYDHGLKRVNRQKLNAEKRDKKGLKAYKKAE